MNVVLFEQLSLFQVLVLWKALRRAKLIYLHRPGIPRPQSETWMTRWSKRWIGMINPKVEIKAVPAEVTAAHNWTQNKEAVDEVERLSPDLKDSWAYRVVLSVVRDEHLLKFFKAMLVADVAERRLFRAVTEVLAVRYGEILVVPKTADSLLTAAGSDINGSPDGIVVACWKLNQILDSVRRRLACFVLLAVPLGFVLKKAGRVKNRKGSARYDVADQVHFGAGDTSLALTGVRNPRHDASRYRADLPPGRVVRVYGGVRQRPEIEADSKKHLEMLDMPYVDWRDFRVTRRVAYLAWVLCLQLLHAWWKAEDRRRERACYLRYAASAAYWLLTYELECDCLEAAVEVIREDYASRHIIKSIVATRHGRKTVGIQHAAGIYDVPQLAYVHVDHYAVCAEGYVRTFLPYWGSLRLERIGRESVDWIVQLVRDPIRVQRLRKALSDKYGVRKHTIVFALAINIDPPPRSRWEELYGALEAFIESELDANVFLRFRRVDGLSQVPHLRRLVELAKQDDRLILEHKDFTTYDLMAVSDVFIANSASFAIYEAIVTRARVFTFDFLGTARHFFPSYGKDFILETKEDLMRVFMGLENDFQGFDCRWDLVRADGDYHYDGCNSERFRALVAEAIMESRSSNGKSAGVAMHELRTISDAVGQATGAAMVSGSEK